MSQVLNRVLSQQGINVGENVLQRQSSVISENKNRKRIKSAVGTPN